MRVTVLGPQRRPTLGQVAASLGAAAPYVVVTAGWQEREPDDGELRGLLDGHSANLGLYGRWLDVQERDREFAVAELEHRAVLDELQQLYLVQLDSALRAVYAVSERGGDRPRARAAALEDAQAVVRIVDGHHAARVRAAHTDFEEAWRPGERDAVAGHRADVRRELEAAGGFVVAGGHVGVLVRVLDLFQVGERLPGTVIAWSAGAMALTEQVVLFHDRVLQGPAHAELFQDGLGVVRGMVLLPHARRRLFVDDATRMAVLARRFAPATCVVLDDGVRVDLTGSGGLPPGARVVGADGRIVAVGGT